VINRLQDLPGQFEFKIIAGATGSAKTRILQAIGELGEQILDLEGLASHKGSVLGVLPDQPQPSQKWFETTLMTTLEGFDPGRPVYVEAESRKVGNLHVPETLIERMRASENVINIEATLEARVRFLLKDYDYFLTLPEFLSKRLEALHTLQSRETLNRWHDFVNQGEWASLVSELLEQHYDPLYFRSQNRNFTAMGDSNNFATDDLSPEGIVHLAAQIVQSRTAQID
jgi:tRNA 2-selenouridine synthase